MIKIVPPSSYDFDESAVQMVKASSRGVVGGDFAALVKRASFRMADAAKRADWREGEVPIHVIALGCTERVGPNRNGDGFDAETCRKQHSTFVKLAKYYRDHANRSDQGDAHYGTVKASDFNERLGRVELLVGLYGTKEAAAHGGELGKVADWELNTLEQDRELPVSMSCRLAHDSCSSCGNKAKSRKYYCLGVDEGGQCKHGGLKNRIGRVCADGHVLHADNPNCSWVDISGIHGKQACRVAYSTGVIDLTKIARAQERVVGGAELAEMVGLSDDVDNDDVTDDAERLAKLAARLADIEQQFEVAQIAADELLNLSAGQGLCERTVGLPHTPSKRAGLELCEALVRRSAMLPLRDYLSAVAQLPEAKSAALRDSVAQRLPGVYTRLVALPNLPYILSHQRWEPGQIKVSTEIAQWALRRASAEALDVESAQKRAMVLLLRGAQTVRRPLSKQAALPDNEMADKLASEYALYRLICLDSWREREQMQKLAAQLLIRQHYLM